MKQKYVYKESFTPRYKTWSSVHSYRFDAFAYGLFGLAVSFACFCTRNIALLFARGTIIGAWRLLGRRARVAVGGGELPSLVCTSYSLEDAVPALVPMLVPLPVLVRLVNKGGAT